MCGLFRVVGWTRYWVFLRVGPERLVLLLLKYVLFPLDFIYLSTAAVLSGAHTENWPIGCPSELLNYAAT